MIGSITRGLGLEKAVYSRGEDTGVDGPYYQFSDYLVGPVNIPPVASSRRNTLAKCEIAHERTPLRIFHKEYAVPAESDISHTVLAISHACINCYHPHDV